MNVSSHAPLLPQFGAKTEKSITQRLAKAEQALTAETKALKTVETQRDALQKSVSTLRDKQYNIQEEVQAHRGQQILNRLKSVFRLVKEGQIQDLPGNEILIGRTKYTVSGQAAPDFGDGEKSEHFTLARSDQKWTLTYDLECGSSYGHSSLELTDASGKKIGTGDGKAVSAGKKLIMDILAEANRQLYASWR